MGALGGLAMTSLGPLLQLSWKQKQILKLLVHFPWFRSIWIGAGISDMYWPGGLAPGQLGSRKAQGVGTGPFGAMPLLNYTQRTSRVKNSPGSIETVTHYPF